MNQEPQKEHEAENPAASQDVFENIRIGRSERLQSAIDAFPALQRLIDAMQQQTGQSYKLRSLLYSLWNGHPTDLSDTLILDWPLKKDFCAVLLAFGYENGKTVFFYKTIQTALKQAGLFRWFINAGEESGVAA